VSVKLSGMPRFTRGPEPTAKDVLAAAYASLPEDEKKRWRKASSDSTATAVARNVEAGLRTAPVAADASAAAAAAAEARGATAVRACVEDVIRALEDENELAGEVVALDWQPTCAAVVLEHASNLNAADARAGEAIAAQLAAELEAFFKQAFVLAVELHRYFVRSKAAKRSLADCYGAATLELLRAKASTTAPMLILATARRPRVNL
jgi:hypothetical protein